MASWTLHDSQAVLNHGGLQAELDLAHPGKGLRRIVVGSQPMENAALLGVAIQPRANEAADAYVRVGDLVATYVETPDRPARVQIYWRAGTSDRDMAGDAAIVDLQVSVQTDQLGVPTPIETVSRIEANEVWRLTSVTGAAFIPLKLSGDPLSIRASDGTGCLLFRTRGGWSYVEMIHPADFYEDQLAAIPNTASELLVEHRLFPDALEKGVIMRGRIRAAWLPRDRDQDLALALYRGLLNMPPPLTT